MGLSSPEQEQPAVSTRTPEQALFDLIARLEGARCWKDEAGFGYRSTRWINLRPIDVDLAAHYLRRMNEKTIRPIINEWHPCTIENCPICRSRVRAILNRLHDNRDDTP